MRHITTLLRMGTVVALAGLTLLALPPPTHARARMAVGIGVPAPVVIAPPPPVVVVRPPLIAGGYLIIPLCSMSPKFLKLLKRGHENASRGSPANPPLASICA